MSVPPGAVLAGLAAAMCFATNSVFQHHGVNRAAAGRVMRGQLLARVAARPVWLLGSAAGLVAVGLQALALAWGPVSVVQPLLVTALLFALPATVLVRGRRPAPAEWVWACVLIVGLVLFLASAHPESAAPGRVRSTGLLVATLALGVLGGLVVGMALWARTRYRAVLLGAASGVGYGLAGALGRYCLVQLQSGPRLVLTDWPLWALLAVVVLSVVVEQVAFRAGPLAASLPPITVLEPLVAVFLGVTTLDESVGLSLGALVGEGAGGITLLVALMFLARHASRAPSR